MNKVIVEVGSNINPIENIKKAKELLSAKHNFIAQSQFKQTKPIGQMDQPDFINGAYLIETTMELDSFTGHLKEIEQLLGRRPTDDRNSPRSIDLDIIIWNGRIMSNNFHTRDFVKQAVLYLLPDLEY